MADYVIIDNYSRLGKKGISRRTLKTIVAKAVGNVAGASVAYKKNAKDPMSVFQIAEPITVFLRKDGLVDVQLSVNLDAGVKVSIFARRSKAKWRIRSGRWSRPSPSA